MQGFFAWEGVCWYRKAFTLPDITDRAVYLYFGGAYRNSEVFINGNEAGGRASGYSSFELDITEFVKKGKNIVAVKLDNGCQTPDRWYSGSGLYRDVYLKVLPLTHIKTWGVRVDAELSDDKKEAGLTVTTTIKSQNKGKGKLRLRILGADDKKIAENTVEFNSGSKTEINVVQKLVIKKPQTWSADNPYLYRAVVQLETDADEAQAAAQLPTEVRFGICRIEIAYNSGMTVNGEKVKLKGVCLHHDAGITGSAYYDDVWRRRLEALKNIGCNAIRTSHNLHSEELLDLCDELGFYVIDECFDKWKSGYYAELFESDAERDLTGMILRDRNHPCVFMWSIGNEVENQGMDSMLKLQKYLTGIVRSLDSRPVTCALSPHANPRTLVGAPVEELVKLTEKLAKDVDILGLNYHEPLYQAYTDKIKKPIVGTECYEYYSSVGTNFEDVSDKNPWQFVLENDNVIGQFIWAGIDYLGECPFPAKGWSGSILDICGFMKPNAFFRKSIWTDEPFVYLAFYDQSKKQDYARGRWSFPSMASHLNFDHFHRRTVTAAVFTTCEETELWINGKKMGRRKRADFKNGIIEWTFEYHPGNIEVKGFDNKKEVCSYILKTAAQAQKVKLEPDKTIIKPGGIAHIEISVTDKNGNLYPNDEFLIDFALEGDGEILGVCSPDLNQNLGYTLPKAYTSGGKALAIIKAGDTDGALDITAFSEKLDKAKLKIKVKK
jgi:beta-galactosidase